MIPTLNFVVYSSIIFQFAPLFSNLLYYFPICSGVLSTGTWLYSFHETFMQICPVFFPIWSGFQLEKSTEKASISWPITKVVRFFVVRGYTTIKTSVGDGISSHHDVVQDLLTQKQSLMMELKNYEYNTKYNENLLNETESFENVGAIPASTKLQIALSTVEKTEKVSFVVPF